MSWCILVFGLDSEVTVGFIVYGEGQVQKLVYREEIKTESRSKKAGGLVKS